MLAIRLQRLGRKAYPVYRLAVQEAQRHPSSGRVVAYVGNYNPHTKEAHINVGQAARWRQAQGSSQPREAPQASAEGRGRGLKRLSHISIATAPRIVEQFCNY